jgi:hypothetical protein
MAMQPGSGARVAVDQQPITLVVQNATTSGVRPLKYAFEIATDADFTNPVLTRDGIAPGDKNTSLRLPDALATGRTYYWRAKAQDGANTGPFSAAANFNVFTPIVIQAPGLLGPVGDNMTDTLHPQFAIGNAERSGPVGPIQYLIEVADSDTFANKIAGWVVGEQPDHTVLQAPQDLEYGHQYFWRARAFDPTTVGPYSVTQVFRTPSSPPPPTAPPIGGGGGGCGMGGDAIDLSQAAVYSAPADVASWCVTTKITSLQLRPTGDPQAGVSMSFPAQQSWPDFFPPGWTGGLQYTVWAVVNVNGRWYTSGFIQMWRGRPSTGGPILTDFARNWAYDARWGPMMGHQPVPGEQMGFFVTAGDARGQSGVTSVRERSNVVVVSLPGGDFGNYSW